MEKEITVEEIQRVICKQFKVNLGDLKSKKTIKEHYSSEACCYVSLPQAYIDAFCIYWIQIWWEKSLHRPPRLKKPRKEIKTESLDPDEHYSIGKRPPSRPNPLSRSANPLKTHSA